MNSSPQPGVRRVPIINSLLALDAYDGEGRLLLATGALLDDPVTLVRLLQNDVCFGSPPPRRRQRPTGGYAPDTHVIRLPATLKQVPPPAKTLEERIEQAEEIRNVTTVTMTFMFDRIAKNGNIDVHEARDTVSPMIDSIVEDPRALLSLVSLKDADNYTFVHSVNVAILALSLAVYLDIPRVILDELGIGAVMHDVGKSVTPTAVLRKPGPLSDHEMSIMRQHPMEGAKILAKSGGYSELAITTVLDHHETISGDGYPYGKTGDKLSLCAQITSVADIYDALTTQRPYRRALSHGEALKLMTTSFDTALNQELVSHFIAVLGHYAVGSLVILSNRCVARVLQQDSSFPPNPTVVRIVTMPDGSEPRPAIICNLQADRRLAIRGPYGVEMDDETLQLATREYKPFLAAA